MVDFKPVLTGAAGQRVLTKTFVITNNFPWLKLRNLKVLLPFHPLA
ncbi:hypothetical protein [Palaeococcus sp. (in: euryarchaeotes)]